MVAAVLVLGVEVRKRYVRNGLPLNRILSAEYAALKFSVYVKSPK